jgi:hypothetical protein
MSWGDLRNAVRLQVYFDFILLYGCPRIPTWHLCTHCLFMTFPYISLFLSRTSDVSFHYLASPKMVFLAMKKKIQSSFFFLALFKFFKPVTRITVIALWNTRRPSLINRMRHTLVCRTCLLIQFKWFNWFCKLFFIVDAYIVCRKLEARVCLLYDSNDTNIDFVYQV